MSEKLPTVVQERDLRNVGRLSARGNPGLDGSTGLGRARSPRQTALYRVIFLGVFCLVWAFVAVAVCVFVDSQPASNRASNLLSQTPLSQWEKESFGPSPLYMHPNTDLSGARQLAMYKTMIEEIVAGRVSIAELSAYADHPDYQRCRECVEKCEDLGVELERLAVERIREECRRECLFNCSKDTRRIMNAPLPGF